MPGEPIRIHVVPEEGQFYLIDLDYEWASEIPVDEFWNDLGLAARVGAARHRLIAVSVQADLRDEIPVDVVLRQERPADDALEGWDHAVEASIRCDTSYLTFDEQGDHCRIELPEPGEYRVRVSMAGLDTLEDDEPTTRYRLEIWPQALTDHEVVRWWPRYEPVLPESSEDGRRRIVGVDAYRRAITEMGLECLGTRPLGEVVFDEAILFRAKDGTYWEYTTPPPEAIPQLVEITAEEAHKRFG